LLAEKEVIRKELITTLPDRQGGFRTSSGREPEELRVSKKKK